MARLLRFAAASADVAKPTGPGPSFANRSGAFVGTVNLAAQIVDRLLAFVQIVVVAAVFGATGSADIYFLASIVPLALASAVGEPVGRAMVTLLVRSRGDGARRLAGTGALATLGVFAILTALYLAVALPLVHVFGVDNTKALAPWVAFALIAPAMGFCAYLASLLLWTEQYVWAAIRLPLSTLLGTILLLVAVQFTQAIEWVAASIAGGYAIAAGALYGAVATRLGAGWLLQTDGEARRAVLRLRGKVLAPVLGGVMSGQAIVIVERALAATLQPGSVALLSYARGIAGAPTTASIALGSAAYPRLARAEAAGATAYLRGNFVRGLRLAIFTGASFAAFFAIFASHLIGSLLQRGEFGSGSTGTTAHLLALLALSTLTGSLVIYLAHVLYGINAFGSILWFEGSTFIVYVVLAILLRHAFGLEGLPLAFGFAQLAGIVLALSLIGHRLGIGVLEFLRESVVPLLGRLGLLVVGLVSYRLVAHAVGVPVSAAGLVYVGGGTATLVILMTVLFLSAPLPEAQALRAAFGRRARALLLRLGSPGTD